MLRKLRSVPIPHWRAAQWFAAGIVLLIMVMPADAVRADDPFDVEPASSKQMDEESEEPDKTLVNEPDEFDTPVHRVQRNQVANVDGATETESYGPEVVGSGFGSINRGSFLGGKTFGRQDSIIPLEFMPYILTDEHFIFADVRGFVTTRSQPGANVGLGYRRLMDNQNAWAGASVWYDADQSTTKLFQQIGLSFEGLVNRFEFRSNVYLPFTSSQTLTNSIGDARIVGNQLLFGRSTAIGTALRGVDAEIGYSLPVMDRHVVRGFVGGYHFDGGSTGGVNGFKARAEAVFNNTVTAQVMYTNDKLYGSNVMAGISFQFPFADNHPTSGWTRNTPSPFRFVERNYNVIVAEAQSGGGSLVAADPASGKAYVVEQVNPQNTSGIADGTTSHPFTSVAAAQAAGGNVIVVQSGSVLNESITLAPGQHLFGQGPTTQYLVTNGGAIVPIPNLMQGNSALVAPIIQNATGSAITLASNSEVGGFTISGASGNGVTGSGVSNVSVHDLVFGSIGGDAVRLTNSTGIVSLGNLQVNSALGNGIVLNGGNANINFQGAGSTITAHGNGFVLQNLTGGTVNISDLAINQVGGTGLVISNVATDLTVNSLSVSGSGSSGSAVAITGKTGKTTTYHFAGKTNISSPAGMGFSANGIDSTVHVDSLNVASSASSPAISLVNATNPVTFGNLIINTQNATGLFADTVHGLQVDAGSITTINAPAVDIQGSAVHASFGNISTNGGTYGVRLDSSTGSFAVHGFGGSGGTIQNMTTAGFLINSFGTVNLSGMNFLNNAVAIQSSGSSGLTLSALKITGSTGYAIDSLNDSTFSLTTSNLTGNGAAGGGTIRVQVGAVGTYQGLIQTNTIVDTNGTPIQYLTTAAGAGATSNLRIVSNQITGHAANSALIATNWNGRLNTTITNNIMNAYGAGMTGISLQDPSTTATITANVTTNTITFHKTATEVAASGTGIWIVDGQGNQTNTGASNLTISGNQVVFQAINGTGFRYGLHGTNWSMITGNVVSDQAGGVTGMLFDDVAANSIMSITGNTITCVLGDTLTNHGFIFLQVGTGAQLATQSGATSNFVFHPSSIQSLFSAPSNVFVGGMLIENNVYK